MVVLCLFAVLCLITLYTVTLYLRNISASNFKINDQPDSIYRSDPWLYHSPTRTHPPIHPHSLTHPPTHPPPALTHSTHTSPTHTHLLCHPHNCSRHPHFFVKLMQMRTSSCIARRRSQNEQKLRGGVGDPRKSLGKRKQASSAGAASSNPGTAEKAVIDASSDNGASATAITKFEKDKLYILDEDYHKYTNDAPRMYFAVHSRQGENIRFKLHSWRGTGKVVVRTVKVNVGEDLCEYVRIVGKISDGEKIMRASNFLSKSSNSRPPQKTSAASSAVTPPAASAASYETSMADIVPEQFRYSETFDQWRLGISRIHPFCRSMMAWHDDITRKLNEWQILNPDQRLAYPTVRTSSHCELSVDANKKAWSVLKSITEFRRVFASSYAETLPDDLWQYGSDLWELIRKSSLKLLGPHQEPVLRPVDLSPKILGKLGVSFQEHITIGDRNVFSAYEKRVADINKQYQTPAHMHASITAAPSACAPAIPPAPTNTNPVQPPTKRRRRAAKKSASSNPTDAAAAAFGSSRPAAAAAAAPASALSISPVAATAPASVETDHSITQLRMGIENINRELQALHEAHGPCPFKYGTEKRVRTKFHRLHRQQSGLQKKLNILSVPPRPTQSKRPHWVKRAYPSWTGKKWEAQTNSVNVTAWGNKYESGQCWNCQNLILYGQAHAQRDISSSIGQAGTQNGYRDVRFRDTRIVCGWCTHKGRPAAAGSSNKHDVIDLT